MSTQELASKRLPIRKLMLIGAIATSSVAILSFFLPFVVPIFPFTLFMRGVWYGVFVILYPLPSWTAGILYLIREEQAVAARAWGILGAFALGVFPIVFMPPLGFISIPALILAIGGAVLVLIRPKLAGVLMLAGAIGSGATFLFLLGLAVMVAPIVGWGTPPWHVMDSALVPPLLGISFLIPGGILSLTSRKNQPASRRMVIGVIGALFALPVLSGPVLLGLQYFLYLLFSG